MARTLTQLGGLTCRVQGPDEPRAVKGAIVLCHGFGAPGADLVGIGGELVARKPALAASVRFVFPEAPIDLGPMYGGGRAWWRIDIERYLRARTPEDMVRLTHDVPDGLKEARHKLTAMLDELCRTSGLPLSRVIVGGFSQGAMLAVDTALKLDEAPAALSLFSGALLAREQWQREAPRRKGLPVLMTHGTADEVLPYPVSEMLRDLLTEAGLVVEHHPFRGPHTIPEIGVARLAEIAAERLLA